MWPVDIPPKPPLHTTIGSVHIEAPLNVVIALAALKRAAAELKQIDEAFNVATPNG